jgi:hypothetical protein
MRGHDVFFDPDNSQIGIAESHCSYNNLVTGDPISEFDPYAIDVYEDGFTCFTESCAIEMTFAVLCMFASIGIFYWKIGKKSQSYESPRNAETEAEVEAITSNLPTIT